MNNKIKECLEEVKKQGITVTEIIEKSKVGRTSFYGILNGKQIPKLNTACRIANALGKELVDVFPDINQLEQMEE